MQEYIHRSGNAHFCEAGLKLSDSCLGIDVLTAKLLQSDWSLIEYLTPTVLLKYQWVPYYANSSNYDLYRPFTVYHGSAVIGYYKPGDEEPPQQPGITIFWYPAPSSPQETLTHTALHITDLAPLAVASVADGEGWPYGLRISYPYAGASLNFQSFAPDGSNGIGGVTENGGSYVQSKTYNDCFVRLSIYATSRSPWIIVTFGEIAPNYTYRLGSYTWDCYCGPYQLIMKAQSGTGYVGDVAGGSTGFLVSTPFIPTELESYLTYCGICTGGLYKGEVYTGGGIALQSNQANSRAKINDSYSHATNNYNGSDTGLIFYVMYTPAELYVVNDTSLPVVNPAFVGFSEIPAVTTSIAKVIGNLWDAFIVGIYMVEGSEIELASEIWYCIASQNAATLGQTPASLCVLKED